MRLYLGAAVFETFDLRRKQPQRQAPTDQDGDDRARKERQQPEGIGDVDLADALDHVARGDRAGTGDDHLVEDRGRIGHQEKYSAADIGAFFHAEEADDPDADRRHDDDAGNTGRHDESQQEGNDDEAKQKPRISQADDVDDEARDALRQSGFRRHGAEEHGADIEPRRVIDEAAEDGFGLGDAEDPEQEQSDET